MDILSHFWSYMKCSQIFTIEYDISCWFIIEGLYYIDIWSLCAHFVESFFLNYKWVLKFVRSCFWIYSDNHVLFIQFVDVVYPIDWFVEIWKNLCIPKVNSSWSLVYDPFNVAFVGFGLLAFCWWFLCLQSSMILACGFLFCVCDIFVMFGIRVIMAL